MLPQGEMTSFDSFYDDEEERVGGTEKDIPVIDEHQAVFKACFEISTRRLRKLADALAGFDSIIEFLSYATPDGFAACHSVERSRRKDLLDETVHFLEWFLSDEKVGSPTTLTYIELCESQGLDFALWRELVMVRIEDVFTPKFKMLLREYLSYCEDDEE